jgi:hypothetical protein
MATLGRKKGNTTRGLVGQVSQKPLKKGNTTRGLVAPKCVLDMVYWRVCAK